MKFATAIFSLTAGILAFAIFGPALATDAGAPAISAQALQAKIQFCSTCHGPMGQGFKRSFSHPATLRVSKSSTLKTNCWPFMSAGIRISLCSMSRIIFGLRCARLWPSILASRS